MWSFSLKNSGFSKSTSDRRVFEYLSLNKWAGEVLASGRECCVVPDTDWCLFCFDFYEMLIIFCSLLKISKKYEIGIKSRPLSVQGDAKRCQVVLFWQQWAVVRYPHAG